MITGRVPASPCTETEIELYNAWHFNLVKQHDEWLIGAVDTR